MSIVPTGVHNAVVFGAVRDIVFFLNRERVHVGAIKKNAALTASSAAQQTYHTGPAYPFGDLVSDLAEPLGYFSRGRLLVVSKLGVAVKAAPVGDELFYVGPA
jgi:hypothetical protein